jgi:PAS domain S-box-containing protein
MAGIPREIEHRYRLLIETLSDSALFMTDTAGNVLSWNEGAERITGYSEGEIVGKPASVIFTPKDRADEIPQSEFSTAERDGRATDERWYLRRDGSRFFANGVMTSIRDEAGRLIGFAKVLRDFTAGKLAADRLVTEHAVARVLAEAASLREGIPQILEVICRTSHWQWGGMWSVDPHENLMRWVDSWHEPAPEASAFRKINQESTFAIGIGLPGRVWASGDAAWVPDVLNDTNFPRHEAAANAGLHGAICFPVTSGGEVFGVMEFFSSEIRSPDESLMEMMLVIGRQVGQFMRRRRVQAELRSSEARHVAILETALDCIVTMDHHGMIREWNPAAERVFGVTREEALGREMAEIIIPPSYRLPHREGLRRYLATGEARVIGKRFEITGIRKDGSEFPVELAITRLPSDGPPLFTGHLRDITDRKQTEASLAQARDASEAANKAKDQFLAALSHELRTPLTPVLLTVSLLEGRSDLPQEVIEDLRGIRRNVELEARLIDDLLDLTKIAKGKLQLHSQRTDVHSLINSAVFICGGQEKTRKVNLHLDAKMPCVYGDPARLQQVFWNLLTNAQKFTPDGGEVTVRSANVGKRLIIEVADNGIGIAEELLPKLFNAFEQGGGSTTHRFGGLGLGLAIAKALVEAHEGTITVRSDGPGKGATFTVELPGSQEGTSVEEHSQMTAHAEPSPRRLLRILLVEDHDSTLEVMSRLLKKLGHQVSPAMNVADALKLADSAEFDLLISDLGLPDGSGHDLMQSLQARKPGGLRGIALSGYGMEDDVRRSIEVGFNTHLTKPVDFQKLEAAVRALANEIK